MIPQINVISAEVVKEMCDNNSGKHAMLHTMLFSLLQASSKILSDKLCGP